MTQKPQRHIIVDGVRYDIASGRVISNTQGNSQAPAGPTVLDLRTPKNEATMQPVVKNHPVVSVQSPEPTRTMPIPQSEPIIKLKKPRRSLLQNKKKKTTAHAQSNSGKNAKTIANESSHQSPKFLSFVLARGIWPQAKLSLWQFSLVRTIASPQTWLLLTLPLLLLQVRVLQNLTLNESLQKAKSFVLPDHYSVLTISIGLMLAAFLFGVIIRSVITASGMYVRLREIDHRSAKLSLGLRSAMHSLLRQCLNYIIHFFFIITLTLFSAYLAKLILASSNVWIMSSKYQLLVALIIVWLGILILLYSKHWLQIGLLARSNKSAHIQLQSFKMLFSAPLKNGLIGSVGLLLIGSIYAIIFAMSWNLTNYFVQQNRSPVLFLLIGVSVVTILLLATVQYIQQNLWARQYYYLASNQANRNELLYMEREKPASVWPLFVALALAGTLLLIYTVIVTHYASSLRGQLANLHAAIPDEIHLVIPLKKN